MRTERISVKSNVRTMFICILGLIVLTLVTGCASNEAAKINEAAFIQYEEGLYQEAVDAYSLGIKEFPEYMDFYTNRGMAYYELGDTDNALLDLDFAISLSESAPEAYLNRGLVYLGLGKYQESLVDFYKAIDQKSDFESEEGLYYTYLNLGTLLNEIGETKEALVVYELALGENDQDPSLFNAMGLLYTVDGQYDKALEYFNRSLDMNQNFGYAYGNRGNLYYQLGEFEIALSDANTALSIDPYIPQVYDLKAKVLIELGDTGNAKKTIAAGLRIWESHANLYISLANIFMAEENYGEALINYGLAVRYGNVEGHKGQGIAYRLIGQFEDSIVSLESYKEQYPNDLGVMVEIGLSQQGLGLHTEAINTYQAILTVAPDNTDVKYYLALSYEYIEDYNKAIELLKDVISNDQSNIQAKEELEFINKHLKK